MTPEASLKSQKDNSSRIRIPKNSSQIPDPEGKKVSDPESGLATLTANNAGTVHNECVQSRVVDPD
jgi:hypothetical protein